MAHEDPKPKIAHERLESEVVSRPLVRNAEGTPEGPAAPGDRYEDRGSLGQGGMGEVRLFLDRGLGRLVAVKRLRHWLGAQGESQRRFLREVSIQGQLEHPGVVPVYDLGVGPLGEPYFTMRRVRGEPLDRILQGLRNGDASIRREFPLHRLLTVFVAVCQTIEYAHARGVIHRDLKPANIMLGAFGEVHVLDWGIAKVNGSPTLNEEEAAGDEGPVCLHEPLAQATRTGAILGTLGYMAPEQQNEVKAPHSPLSDVYALGAILYELVQGQPYHRFLRWAALREKLPEGQDKRVDEEAPSTAPPALEALWRKALQREPSDRLASVKLLREGVEDHLAQDKDLERRRELSRSHAQAAKDAAREAFRPGEQGLVARRGALREVAIALSFLPSNEDAARLLSELMRKPPTVVPAELAAEKEKREEERRRRYLASVSRFALGTLFFLPASVVAGVIDDRLFALDLGLWSLAGLSAHGMSRRPRVEESAVLIPALFAYGGLLGILPVMGCLAPFMIVISALLVDVHLELVRRSVVHRRVAVLLSLGFLGATFLLQKYGYVSAAIDFGGDEIRVMSKMLRFDPKTGPPMLALATMVSVAFFYRRMWVVQQQLGDAEDQEELAQWQWRQLIPPAPAGTNPAEPKAH